MESGKKTSEGSLRTIEDWVATSADHKSTEIQDSVLDEFLPLINTISGAFTQTTQKMGDMASEIESLREKARAAEENKRNAEVEKKTSDESIAKLQEEIQRLKQLFKSKKVAFSSDAFDSKPESAPQKTQQTEEKEPKPEETQADKMDLLQARNQLKKLETVNRKLQFQLNSLTEEHSGCQNAYDSICMQKSTEIQKLYVDFNEKESKLNSKIQADQIEIQNLQKQVSQFDEKMGKKDQRIDTLKGIIEKKDSDLGTLHVQISELNQSLAESTEAAEASSKLQEKLNELESNREREKTIYLRNCEMIRAECNDKVTTCQKRVAELEKSLNETYQKNEELSSTIKEATENAKSIVHESKVLSSKVQDLEEQNSALVQEKSQLEEKLSMISANQTEVQISNIKDDEHENENEENQNKNVTITEEEEKEEIKLEEEPKPEQQQEVKQEQTEQTEQHNPENVAERGLDGNPEEEEEEEDLVEKPQKSEEQKEDISSAAKDPRLVALEQTVVNLQKKVDDLSAMMSPVSQRNQHNASLEETANLDGNAIAGETVTAKHVVEQLSDLTNTPKDETEENATEIIRRSRRRIINLQRKYSDAREVIKTVKSLVEETNPIICHASLSRIFGLE